MLYTIWYGEIKLSGPLFYLIDVTEKSVTMSSSCDSEGGNKQVLVCVTVERNDCWELFLHAQHWFINKTGLPLQMKVGYLRAPIRFPSHFPLSLESAGALVTLPESGMSKGGGNRLPSPPWWSVCSFVIYTIKSMCTFQGAQSDAWYEVTDEPLLWSVGARARRRVARVRVRAHHSAWSRAARLAAAAPGLVVCPHTERRTNYRLLLNVSTE